jgi:glutamyl-tRNA reductase
VSVLAIGLNHSTAPLDLRGRFAIPGEALARSLQGLREHLAQLAPEVAILSTCNRTELYVAVPASGCSRPLGAEAMRSQAQEDPRLQALAAPVVDWLAQRGGLDADRLRPHSYAMQGPEAARHAFRVASGLDSMVLGEPQILGQIKQAVREAKEAGALGSTLHQLFQQSFAVAKEVRSTTDIGAHAVSTASAAVRLALQLFEDLHESDVLFVGAGEMIELVATHFRSRKPRSLTVANRSRARAQSLCQRLSARDMPLSDLGRRLHEFDIVVSCTSSSLPLIGFADVERALKARRHRPMLMLDLAVPRDIDPEVARLPDAYLYTLDDLASHVQANGARRRAAVHQAERIVETGVQQFSHWLEQRASVPLVQALQRQADDWRVAELDKARRALARGQDVDRVMVALSCALTRKMLHGPLSELHSSVGESHRHWRESVQRLFLKPSVAPRSEGDTPPSTGLNAESLRRA